MRFGIDRAAMEPASWGCGGRVGLVTNHAARLGADPGRPGRVALLEAGVRIVRLFAPEHGLWAAAADGEAVPDGHDPVTGLPVTSLYGNRLQPGAAELEGLEAVLFDVQDAGIRFYTYLWSLFHLMQVAARLDRRVVVLDRPNLLGGDLSLAEGPILDVDSCGSFLGRTDMPVRHSLTIGELARLWQAERFPRLALDVVPLDGWEGRPDGRTAGLALVPPSPALTSWTAIFLYGGLCLFEATNLSVGRGSEFAFQTIGAPWLRAGRLLRWIEECPDLRRVKAETVDFVPGEGVWAGELCHGVRFSPAAGAGHRPVSFGLRLLSHLAAEHQEHFAWRPYPTAANPGGERHLELLLGRAELARLLRVSPAAVDSAAIRQWTAVPNWATRARPFLLYDG